jgi:lipopolysaccharide transport system permease protein
MTLADTPPLAPHAPAAAVAPAMPALATELPPNPDLVIRPSRGWSALNLAEVWAFRDLLFTLAGRDLKVRYKQTFLGVAWVILQPLMAAGVFNIVFGMVAKMPSDGVPYLLFTFVGQLGWNMFANTVSKSSGSLVGNGHLISKVYFPRLVLPLSGLPSTFVDFAVAALMMVGLMVWYHWGPGTGLVFLPLWVAMLLAMALGIGLITAALTVSYRDVGYILPVMMQIAMYASPVPYSVKAVPESLRFFYDANPLSAVLEGFRWSLLNTQQPNWGLVGYAGAVAVVLLVTGAFMFKRMERKFADVV